MHRLVKICDRYVDVRKIIEIREYEHNGKKCVELWYGAHGATRLEVSADALIASGVINVNVPPGQFARGERYDDCYRGPARGEYYRSIKTRGVEGAQDPNLAAAAEKARERYGDMINHDADKGTDPDVAPVDDNPKRDTE